MLTFYMNQFINMPQIKYVKVIEHCIEVEYKYTHPLVYSNTNNE
jgi:hypothetical protein